MAANCSAKVVIIHGGVIRSLVSAVPFLGTPKSATISLAKFVAILVFLSQYGSNGLVSDFAQASYNMLDSVALWDAG